MKKIRIAVLFGGRSGEHSVSLHSAASVMRNLNADRYDLYPLGITRDGGWYWYRGKDMDAVESDDWHKDAVPAVLSPDPTVGGFFAVSDPETVYPLDVVFPVMHGPNAEDGTIQGVCKLAGLPCVGAGVLSSAVSMDKGMTKTILKHAGLNQVPYVVLYRHEWQEREETAIERIESALSYPVFVKPANLGSSVGITKVKERSGLIAALKEADRYDPKLVIEQGVTAWEIECAVLGNEKPRASTVGRIKPCHEFYDYAAKYETGDDSELVIPADIDESIQEQIREMALTAYKALDCAGLARADFFYDPVSGKIYINELNTIPGFTRISMYAKLWAATGLPYPRLCDTLIFLAIEKG
jgi:D-alanine-D-alanine ligase